MSIVFDIVFVALCISLAMICYRLVKGPTLPDRAIASDQISVHVVMLIAVYSMSSQQPILVDLIIVIAIVGFLSLAVIGIYIERAARKKLQQGEGGD